MQTDVNTFVIAAAASADNAPVWLRLLPVGTFRLRDGRGPFTVASRAELQAVVERTKARLGDTQLMVDYDHQGAYAAVPGVGGRAEAAGWISQLEARDDGVWGQVEWTADASAKIAARAYRYLSPLFTADKAGRVGTLVNVALVNMPALDLSAIAASLTIDSLEPEKVPSMDKIAKALGLADSASPEAILAALTAQQAAIAAAVGLRADAAQADIVAAAAALQLGAGKVAVAAGLDATAGADAVIAAMAQTVPATRLQQLEIELSGIKAQRLEDEAKALVAAAVLDGRVTPANEAWALDYAKKDPAGFKTFVASSPRLVAAHSQIEGRQVPGVTDLPPQTVAARALAWQGEQAAAGVHVTISEAVTHVEAEAAKGKK